MWPVSRREAILHFAQNSAETSRNRGRAHGRKDHFPASHEEDPMRLSPHRAKLVTASSQPEGPGHGRGVHSRRQLVLPVAPACGGCHDS